MTNFRDILRAKYPNDEWSVDDDYDSLIWLSQTPKPSETDLLNAEKEIASENAKLVSALETARIKLAALGLTEAEVKALVG